MLSSSIFVRSFGTTVCFVHNRCVSNFYVKQQHDCSILFVSLLFCPGKKRRLTIIECSNDMNMMIDVAKVADLVSGYRIVMPSSSSYL